MKLWKHILALLALFASPALADSPPFNATSIATLGGNCGGTGALPYQASGAVTQCLAASTNGLVLTLAGGIPVWSTGVATGTIGVGAANQLAYYAGAGIALSPLPSGTNGQVLTLVAGVPTWSTGGVSQAANTFLAAPNGAAGVPSYRAIVAADLPTTLTPAIVQPASGSLLLSSATATQLQIGRGGALDWFLSSSTGALIPTTDNTRDFGSTVQRIANVYAVNVGTNAVPVVNSTITNARIASFNATNLGASGTVSAANNAALSAMASSAASFVTRYGYASAFDGPSVVYASSGSACSIGAGAGDGGSQVASSDGKCWLAQFGGTANAASFGAFPANSASANATAMQNWLNAASATLALQINEGTYNTSAALANTTVCSFCTIEGTGTGATVINYTGAVTTVNILTLGNATTLSEGMTVSNIRITSSTVMTAGAGIRLNMLSSSHVSSLYATGLQGGGRQLWDGVTFAGIHEIFADEFETYAQNDCIAMYGSGSGGGDIYLTHHIEYGCTNGIHVGGNLGGVFVGVGQSINNTFANVKIDNALTAVANSVLFFGNMFHTDGVLATNYNYYINETVAGAIWLQIAGETGSATIANIDVAAAPSSNISISAPFISGSARGVYVHDASTQINIASGVSIIGNTTGVAASVPTANIVSNASNWGNTTDYDANTGIGSINAVTPSAFSGTFTSATASVIMRQINQHTAHIEISVVITTNGTAAGGVVVPLPITPTTSNMMACSVAGVAGYAGYNSGVAGVSILRYDGIYPGGDGYTLKCSGEMLY